MRMRSIVAVCAGLLALAGAGLSYSAEITRHELEVTLQPGVGRLFGEATLHVEKIEDGRLTLRLGPGFALQEVRWQHGEEWRNARIGPGPIDSTGRTRWSVTMAGLEASETVLELRWGGAPGPLAEARARVAAGATWSYLSSAGAVLTPLGGWYPAAEETTGWFALTATVPATWEAISEGAVVEFEEGSEQTRTFRYEAPHELPGLHLVAGPFTRTEREHRSGKVVLYHEQGAPGVVVRRTLLAMRQLLDELVGEAGPWSWSRFALVQHPEVERIDAPSLSVLGPKAWSRAVEDRDALRLVVAHAWWPGTVYPARGAEGAWADGLAEFVAGHRLQLADTDEERRAARRTRLWRVHGDQPRPVDRAVLAFGMLENKLGRKRFGEALRGFLVERRYQVTGWKQLLASFSRVVGEPLQPLAGEWLEREGLPELEVTEARARPRGGGARVAIGIGAQPEWNLDVPVELRGAEGERVRGVVSVRAGSGRARLSAPFVPRRLRIDPDQALLRRLKPAEVPARLGALQRTPPQLIVIGSARGSSLERAARHLAVVRAGKRATVRSDRELSPASLEASAPVLVLGRPSGALAERLGSALPPQIRLAEDSISVGGEARSAAGTALAVALNDGERTWVLVDALSSAALTEMSGRLETLAEHSWVVLDGEEVVAAETFPPPGHFDVDVTLEGEQGND